MLSGPFVVPAATGLLRALQKVAFCATTGFFVIMGAMLVAFCKYFISLYFLLVVRYNRSYEHFTRRVERPAHGLAWWSPARSRGWCTDEEFQSPGSYLQLT